jgi:hypothetical protein
MSTRVWVVGVGMLVTQMMMVEKRTTVMPRIMMVPMTSDTPDSSSCNTVFMGGLPVGFEIMDLDSSRRYIKCSR